MMSEVRWIDLFADRLGRLMMENNMSQRELSRLTGLSQGTISKYLNRQIMPSVHALINIAHVFPEAQIDDLLYFGDQIEPRPSRRW